MNTPAVTPRPERGLLATLRAALVLLGAFTLLTGLVYPLAITGLSALLFPRQAAGSLVDRGGVPAGSTLIGQPFTSDAWFWSRPSATTPGPNNAASSSGSNLGPSNPALRTAMQERVDHLHASGTSGEVPIDLVTTSGSGLDPHISPAAARLQVARVARQRGLDQAQLQALVDAHTERRFLGVFGGERVNVLELNLALEAGAHPKSP